MTFALASIVEGYGEQAAVPLIVRTHWPKIEPLRPIRFPRQNLVKPDVLHRAAAIAEAAVVTAGGCGGVLLLLDADHDCAATLASSLAAELARALPHRTCRCVLAVREFESWLVAGHRLAGSEPDERRPTKAWLRAQNEDRYQPTVDQPRFTSRLDIEQATRLSRSFRKFRSVMEEFNAYAETAETSPTPELT
jgi:hypothetical protein